MLGQPERRDITGPFSSYVRFFYYFWCLVSANILCKAYATTLLSYLTVPIHEKPIDTLQELYGMMRAQKVNLGALWCDTMIP